MLIRLNRRDKKDLDLRWLSTHSGTFRDSTIGIDWLFLEKVAEDLSRRRLCRVKLRFTLENLEDLFEKFPEGFGIFSDDIYDYKEGKGYFYQSIELKGDAENEVVRGTLRRKSQHR